MAPRTKSQLASMFAQRARAEVPDGDPDSDGNGFAELRAAIVKWFRAGHRDLPWRRTRDPYAVWVSEIMLQQTRVDTVTPRFTSWMARFPTVSALAEAPLDDVLAEWSGLGYYARARNLHKAAQVIVDEHGGRVPNELDAVMALPGIGRYTAGAIMSIAHGQPVPILDGNVERVLSRVYRVEGDPGDTKVKAKLWELAGRVVERAADPSALNQGLMELGALVCSARKPACLTCPLRDPCKARRHGDAERFPAPSKKQKIGAQSLVTVALVKDGKVLLARRPTEGLWGGLFELPSGEPLVGESHHAAAVRIAEERVGLKISVEGVQPFSAPNHLFTQELSHLRVTFHAFRADEPRGRVKRSGYDAHQWIDISRARLVGISRATHRLLAALAVPKARAATRSPE